MGRLKKYQTIKYSFTVLKNILIIKSWEAHNIFISVSVNNPLVTFFCV